MQILKLGSNLNINEAKNTIEQNRIQLEALINSEDSSSVAVEYLKKRVSLINKILSQFHADTRVDADSFFDKSQSLKQIGDILIDATNQYQESFNKSLFQQVKYLGLWFQGIGKEYEIHALVKKTSEPSEQNVIQLIQLVTDFVGSYWETHPEKVLEREGVALQIAEAEKSGMLGNIMSGKLKEVSDLFVTVTLSSADKVRIRKLKSSSQKTKQVVDWMINSPKWQGDDLESCLEIVKNSRIQAEF